MKIYLLRLERLKRESFLGKKAFFFLRKLLIYSVCLSPPLFPVQEGRPRKEL